MRPSDEKVAVHISQMLADRVKREAERVAAETATLPSLDLLAERLIQEALSVRDNRRTPMSLLDR